MLYDKHLLSVPISLAISRGLGNWWYSAEMMRLLLLVIQSSKTELPLTEYLHIFGLLVRQNKLFWDKILSSGEIWILLPILLITITVISLTFSVKSPTIYKDCWTMTGMINNPNELFLLCAEDELEQSPLIYKSETW